MSRKLPEELAPALARTGHQWPETDEDGLRRAAGLWREFGAESERLSRRGADSAHRVTGENEGRAVDAFAEHWRGFSGGGRGHLDDAHAAAEALAGALDRAAGAAEHCKAELISVLTELAEQIEQADATEAKAAEEVAQAGPGLGGMVGKVVGAVRGAIAEAGEEAAVEGAALRIAGLLEDLGRQMRDGLRAALREPAVVALERIAQADGRGLHGELRAKSAARDSGQFSGAVGGAAGGAAAVAGVRALSAAVGPDGRVLTDKAGNPVLLDAEGKPVTGVQGLSVAVDEQGRPVLGEDGNPVLLDAQGTPVTGVATGADGRPLTDSEGHPLTVAADGRLGAGGLSLAVGADGKPVLDADGKPVVTGPDGKPVDALATDRDGRLLTGRDGGPVALGQDRPGGPHDGAHEGLDGLGDPDDPDAGPGGRTGKDGRPLLTVDDQGLTPEHGGRPLLTVDADPLSGTGPVAVTAAAGGFGTDGAGPSRDEEPVTLRAAGGGAPRHQTYSAPLTQPDGYDLPPVAPVHHAAPSVHTDSVVLDPQVVTASAGGDGPGPVSGGGGYRSAEPPVAGGGGSPAGGGAPSGGGFQLGPVGGGSAGSAPVLGTGAPAPVGAGPVGVGPVGGATGAPVGGVGGVVGGGGAVPGGAGAGAAGAGAPVAGQPGATGAAGQPGAAAAVVGGGPVPGGAGARSAMGAPLPGAALGSGSASGAGVTGPVGGSAPVRIGPEGGYELRRRTENPEPAPAAGAPVVALAPGVGAVYLLARYAGRPAPEGPQARPAQVRTIADSRPYGLSGGLGPVDPAHQAEVLRRTAVPEGGSLDLRDDWTEALNGGGPREPGRANNCVDVALSAVDTYLGHASCAAPRLPDGPAGERGGRDRAERELGTRFHDLGDGPHALARLAGSLLRSGPGAQAVLLTLDGFGRSHTWNAVSDGSAVHYLDHQEARRSAQPLHPVEHGLWAIALDADCRPIDLADAPAAATVPVPQSAAPQSAVPQPGVPQPAAPPQSAAPEQPAPPRSRLTAHHSPAAGPRSTRR
ncbi:toxin glutamine deamidase domain-containing protein [Kitasatospora sp. NPDC049258]|uniref:toxin glutamine deamidase domain-containing protein n=1 Tax=Kitasatospora sp. NPDC049258 TaxID=3155394 RepID=UPI003443019C